MWELDHKEVCELKNWCVWTVVFKLIFELWRRLLRVPWTARRSNQSILKEISPEYSLEELMLKFQYFGHLMWRANSLEKTLMLGKIEGRSRRGWQRVSWLGGITDSMDRSLSKLREMVKYGSQRIGQDWATKKQNRIISSLFFYYFNGTLGDRKNREAWTATLHCLYELHGLSGNFLNFSRKQFPPL